MNSVANFPILKKIFINLCINTYIHACTFSPKKSNNCVCTHPETWNEVPSSVVVGTGCSSFNRSSHSIPVILTDKNTRQLPQGSHVICFKYLALKEKRTSCIWIGSTALRHQLCKVQVHLHEVCLSEQHFTTKALTKTAVSCRTEAVHTLLSLGLLLLYQSSLFTKVSSQQKAQQSEQKLQDRYCLGCSTTWAGREVLPAIQWKGRAHSSQNENRSPTATLLTVPHQTKLIHLIGCTIPI